MKCGKCFIVPEEIEYQNSMFCGLKIQPDGF
jgi:hypothetical protein